MCRIKEGTFCVFITLMHRKVPGKVTDMLIVLVVAKKTNVHRTMSP